MAVAGKILAQGALTTTENTVLYTVPASTETWPTSIRIVNVNTTTVRTFNVTTKKSGGSFRNYSDKDYPLAAKAGIQVLDDPQEMRLEAGDIIAGDASANDELHYTIMGGEKT